MNHVSTAQDTKVTVVGLGPMGRAMAAAYLDMRLRGHRLEPQRGQGRRPRGPRGPPGGRHRRGRRREPASTVLSLIDVEAMYGTLGDTDLAGRVLANLSSDVPDAARAAARWAGERGAAYLTGGVNVPPTGIGQEGSSVFVSGPEEVYEEHRAALDVLAATDYRGVDPGYAQLYYQLNMILFWTAYTGWYQALAVARANGLTAADILPYAGLHGRQHARLLHPGRPARRQPASTGASTSASPCAPPASSTSCTPPPTPVWTPGSWPRTPSSTGAGSPRASAPTAARG